MSREPYSDTPVSLFLWAIVLCLLLAMCSGCSTRPEPIRLGDVEEPSRALACPPLPPCDIPEAATAKQLQAALWGCVLEYRGLYARCAHVVKPEPAKLPSQAYGQRWCQLTDPAQCFDGKGRKL